MPIYKLPPIYYFSEHHAVLISEFLHPEWLETHHVVLFDGSSSGTIFSYHKWPLGPFQVAPSILPFTTRSLRFQGQPGEHISLLLKCLPSKLKRISFWLTQSQLIRPLNYI